MGMESVRLEVCKGWDSFKGMLDRVSEKAHKGWKKVSDAVSHLEKAIGEAIHNTRIYKALFERKIDVVAPYVSIINGITQEYAKLQGRFTDLQNNFNNTVVQLGTAKERLQTLTDSLTRVTGEKGDVEARCTELAQKLKDVEADKQKLVLEKAGFEAQLVAEQRVNDSLKLNSDEQRSQIAAQQEKMTDLQQQLEDLQTKQARYQDFLSQLQVDVKKIELDNN